MIKDYLGPKSSPLVFPHLVGETIVGVFAYDSSLYLVFENGFSLCLAGAGASNILSYEVATPLTTKTIYEMRKAALLPDVAAHSALPPAGTFSSGEGG